MKALSLFLACTGWLLLVYAAEVHGGGPGVLTKSMWIATSLLALVASVVLLADGNYKFERIRRVAFSVLILVAAARSFAYLQQGAWSPLGVWTLMAGMLVRMRHLRTRLETLKRNGS